MSGKAAFRNGNHIPLVPGLLAGAFLLGLALLLVLCVLLPAILERVALSELPRLLGRPVELARVGFDPLAMRLSANGLLLRGDDGRAAASFDSLAVDLDVRAMLSGRLAFRRAVLDNPYIRVVRRPDGTVLAAGLPLPAGPGHGEPEKPAEQDHGGKGEGPDVSFGDIRVAGGEVVFEDQAAATVHRLREVRVDLPTGVRPSGDEPLEPHVSALLDSGRIEFAGTADVFGTGRSELAVAVRDLDLRHAAPYLPLPRGTRLASAAADLDLAVGFGGGGGPVVTGKTGLRDLVLVDGAGELLALPTLLLDGLDVDLQARRVRIGTAVLAGPRARVTRDAKGNVNLATLAPARPDRNGGQEQKSRPFSLELGELRLAGARIGCRDEILDQAAVVDISSLRITEFAWPQKKPAQVAMEAATDRGETMRIDGRFLADPLAAEGRVELRGLRPEQYAKLLAARLPVEARGRLDLAGTVKAAMQGGVFGLALSGVTASAGEVSLARAGKEFFRAGRLYVGEGGLDTATREATIGRVEAEGVSLAAVREADGSLDLARLVPPGDQDGKGPAWRVALASATLRQFEGRLVDHAAAEPVTHVLRVSEASVRRYDSRTGSAEIVAAVALGEGGGGGTATASGHVTMAPLDARLRLDLREVDVAPLRLYLPARIKVLPTRGRLTMAGDLALGEGREGMHAAYEGEASLAGVEFWGRGAPLPFLSLKNLRATRLSAGIGPAFFNAREVALTGLDGSLKIVPGGRLDIQELLRADEPGQASPTTHEEGGRGEGFHQLRLDRLVIRESTLRFADETLKPAFRTTMTDLSGSVTGLSLGEVKPADLSISGRQNGLSPLSIKGKVVPLRQNLLVDLSLDFRDIDMVQASPYMRRLFGHPIKRGKATLDLRYRIDRNRLDSNNSVVISNIALGDKSDPGKIDLPIKFVLAVLENRDGDIVLDIPVQGNLDSPEFSLREVIASFFVDLFKKVVMSPLAFLGLPFGGGQDAGAVEFGPGRSEIPAAAESVLQSLATAMKDKPKLDIEIAGYVDPEEDRPALRANMVLLRLQEQKFKDLLKKNSQPGRVEELVIEPREHDRYLEMAYAEEGLPMERNFIGMTRFPSREEMERRLRERIEVTDDDLKGFALRRAAAVRDWLVVAGVPSERIFLESPEALSPPDDGRRKSRAALRLR